MLSELDTLDEHALEKRTGISGQTIISLSSVTLQDMLNFRFSNNIFSLRSWNKEHVEKVEIRFMEKHAVGDRGVIYDSVGALRDVGHKSWRVQMLALTVMVKRPKKLRSGAYAKPVKMYSGRLSVPSKKVETAYSARRNTMLISR